MEPQTNEKIKQARELANGIKNTKEAIRQAIARKAVDIPANTAFADYPAKIDGIYPDALFLRDDYKLGNLDTSIFYKDIAYGNGVYIAIGANRNSDGSMTQATRYYAYGTNAGGWVKKEFPVSYSWEKILFCNGVFLAKTNASSNRYVTSTDGIIWEIIDFPEESSGNNNSNIVAVSNKIFFYTKGSTSPTAYQSEDGISWELVALSGIGSFSYMTFNPDNNTLYALDASKRYIYATSDGQNWNTLAQIPTDDDVGSLFCAGGNKILYSYTNRNYNRCLGSYDISSNGFKSLKTVIDFDDIKYGSNGIFILPYSSYSYIVYDSNNLSNRIDLPISDLSVASADKVFIGYANGKFIAYAYEKTLYSYYPYFWLDSLVRGLQDVSGNDVTNSIFYYLLGVIDEVFMVAYREGVNSYTGDTGDMIRKQVLDAVYDSGVNEYQ